MKTVVEKGKDGRKDGEGERREGGKEGVSCTKIDGGSKHGRRSRNGEIETEMEMQIRNMIEITKRKFK